MKGMLEQIIKKHFDFLWRTVAINEWKEIENDKNTFVPVFYGNHMIVYQNQYFSELFYQLQDVSIVIYNGGRPYAIWPLCFTKEKIDTAWNLSSWGGEFLLPPLLKEIGANDESKRKFLKKCYCMLQEICEKLFINKCIFAEAVMGKGLSLSTRLLLENGLKITGIREECFLDLRLDEEEILKQIRRTNKYSIKKAENLYSIRILNRDSDIKSLENAFQLFEEFHIQVSGRRTRSHQTWMRQLEACKECDDFLVMLYDKAEVVGISLYSVTATEGYYSVAVYKRELFDKPLAHLSQWEAIKHMKKLGLLWYHIGTRPYSGSDYGPTEKEVAIGHFKEGFATNIYNMIYIDMVNENKIQDSKNNRVKSDE